MNIRRVTNYRALVLAAEAGALNVKATTPEEEARVEELIREAEAVIQEKPLDCPLLNEMLEQDHASDHEDIDALFPDHNFDCYDGVPSTCRVPGTFGNGLEGNLIAARVLCRFEDTVNGMMTGKRLDFKEAMHLLAHLMEWLYEHHRNTGVGDTEPQYAITDAVNQVFINNNLPTISRNEWDDYLQREQQTV